MLYVNSNPWEATHTTNRELLPETKQRTHTQKTYPFLRFAQTIPAFSPLLLAQQTQKNPATANPELLPETKQRTHTQKTKPFLRFAQTIPSFCPNHSCVFATVASTANAKKPSHSKPRIVARNQTEDPYTENQTIPSFRPNHSCVFATVASTANAKKPIILLSQRRPSAPFPSLPIHLFAGQPIHRKPKPLHF